MSRIRFSPRVVCLLGLLLFGGLTTAVLQRAWAQDDEDEYTCYYRFTCTLQPSGYEMSFRVPGSGETEDDVERLIRRAPERFGRLDVVFNNAGLGGAFGPITEIGVEDWDYTFNVLVRGVFLGIKHAARVMIDQGEGGPIINTASVAAFDGQIGQAAYSASKAGVAGMTLPVARDLSRNGIRVCTIAPGIFETPMMAGATDRVREPLLESVQYPKRLGNPEEYALLARQIIENGYLNGETIRLDGGQRFAPK